MKILVETCLNDLYLLLFNKNKIFDRVLLINLKKKSEQLPLVFNDLLIKNNLNIKDIEEFYVTQGPGSFMGIRAGLLFIKTLAGTLNKNVYIGTTFDFLCTDKKEKIYVKAGGNNFYVLVNKKIKLLTGDFSSTKTNYHFIENNLERILSRFKKTDHFKDDAFYMKEPTIG